MSTYTEIAAEHMDTNSPNGDDLIERVLNAFEPPPPPEEPKPIPPLPQITEAKKPKRQLTLSQQTDLVLCASELHARNIDIKRDTEERKRLHGILMDLVGVPDEEGANVETHDVGTTQATVTVKRGRDKWTWDQDVLLKYVLEHAMKFGRSPDGFDIKVSIDREEFEKLPDAMRNELTDALTRSPGNVTVDVKVETIAAPTITFKPGLNLKPLPTTMLGSPPLGGALSLGTNLTHGGGSAKFEQLVQEAMKARVKAQMDAALKQMKTTPKSDDTDF